MFFSSVVFGGPHCCSCAENLNPGFGLGLCSGQMLRSLSCCWRRHGCSGWFCVYAGAWMTNENIPSALGLVPRSCPAPSLVTVWYLGLLFDFFFFNTQTSIACVPTPLGLSLARVACRQRHNKGSSVVPQQVEHLENATEWFISVNRGFRINGDELPCTAWCIGGFIWLHPVLQRLVVKNLQSRVIIPYQHRFSSIRSTSL